MVTMQILMSYQIESYTELVLRE